MGSSTAVSEFSLRPKRQTEWSRPESDGCQAREVWNAVSLFFEVQRPATNCIAPSRRAR